MSSMEINPFKHFIIDEKTIKSFMSFHDLHMNNFHKKGEKIQTTPWSAFQQR